MNSAPCESGVGRICPITGEKLVEGKGPSGSALDHDHATGNIRDFIAARANRGLGFFRDNPQELIAAAAYLLKHRGFGDPYGEIIRIVGAL